MLPLDNTRQADFISYRHALTASPCYPHDRPGELRATIFPRVAGATALSPML